MALCHKGKICRALDQRTGLAKPEVGLVFDLQIVLNGIFRENVYRESFVLRGIYMTGDATPFTDTGMRGAHDHQEGDRHVQAGTQVAQQMKDGRTVVLKGEVIVLR